MPKRSLRKKRLYEEKSLYEGAIIQSAPDRKNYCLSVMRMKAGDKVIFFNEKDGEWEGELIKTDAFIIKDFLRIQDQKSTGFKLNFFCSEVKDQAAKVIVRQLTEIGVDSINFFQGERSEVFVNVNRLKKIAIEASEQCERISVPDVCKLLSLSSALQKADQECDIIFGCIEREYKNIPTINFSKISDIAIFIGPEGGFSEAEKIKIKSSSKFEALSLGNLILRSDTASCVAAAFILAAIREQFIVQ